MTALPEITLQVVEAIGLHSLGRLALKSECGGGALGAISLIGAGIGAWAHPEGVLDGMDKSDIDAWLACEVLVLTMMVATPMERQGSTCPTELSINRGLGKSIGGVIGLPEGAKGNGGIIAAAARILG